MSKRDIFLAYAGHINIDIVLQVDHLTDDITNKVSSVEEQFGGTAGNFSLVASSLEIPFLIYSTVSGRSHGKYLEYMKGRGIDSSGITVTEDSFGPVCYAVNDGLKQKYYMAEGPMANALYKKKIKFGKINPGIAYSQRDAGIQHIIRHWVRAFPWCLWLTQ